MGEEKEEMERESMLIQPFVFQDHGACPRYTHPCSMSEWFEVMESLSVSLPPGVRVIRGATS